MHKLLSNNFLVILNENKQIANITLNIKLFVAQNTNNISFFKTNIFQNFKFE